MPPFLDAVLPGAVFDADLCAAVEAGFLALALAAVLAPVFAADFDAVLGAALAALLPVLLVLPLAALLALDEVVVFLSTVIGRAPAANRQPIAMIARLRKIPMTPVGARLIPALG